MVNEHPLLCAKRRALELSVNANNTFDFIGFTNLKIRHEVHHLKVQRSLFEKKTKSM